MTAAEAVAQRIKAITAVTALVSTRVYVLKLPEHPTLPAVVVQRIDDAEGAQLRGVTKLIRSRVQIDTYAEERSGTDPYAAARNVDEAICGPGDGTALFGWKGTAGTLEVEAVLPDSVREVYEAGELRQVRMIRDVLVWHHV